MRVIRSLRKLADAKLTDREVCVTIGNFDGFHLGHQALFNAVFNDNPTATHVILSFYPHPREFLSGLTRAQCRQRGEFVPILPLHKKLKLASERGFHLFFLARFNQSFSNLHPEEFIKTYLVQGLNASCVVVGHDWSFGKARAGGVEDLIRYGEKFGFKVKVIPPQVLDGSRVGSSMVRKAIVEGRVEDATNLLGRNFTVSGKVERGKRRGTELGFPTANLRPDYQIVPGNGVYITNLWVEKQLLRSVTNIGVRPTFGGGERVVETHVLDCSPKLYNKKVELEFLKFIRPEKKFASVEEIKRAIAQDCERARAL